MDRDPEELQSVGFVGIFGEAAKILRSWRRLFGEIAVALVLPLSLVSLAHILVSGVLFAKIGRNEDALAEGKDQGSEQQQQQRLLARLASDYAALLLFKAGYLIAVLVLALLSTSAVVYTVACVYTAKEVSFRKVLSVVPKVWRRLMVTFLYSFLILLSYNAAAVVVTLLILVLFGSSTTAAVILLPLAATYVAGLVYIGVVWHLASVVSVLEDARGVAALRKSRELIRGKVGVAVAIFIAVSAALQGIEVGFVKLVVRSTGLGPAARAAWGVALAAALTGGILLGLVVQAVVYFVCKAYHHENIDKSTLADHLEVYLGEYVPLTMKDIELRPGFFD